MYLQNSDGLVCHKKTTKYFLNAPFKGKRKNKNKNQDHIQSIMV